MFGFKIVKKTYISDLNSQLNSYMRSYANEVNKAIQLKMDVEGMSKIINDLKIDIDSKDSHILKIGESLSKAREMYDTSIKEKEDLKKAYIDLERKNKVLEHMLEALKKKSGSEVGDDSKDSASDQATNTVDDGTNNVADAPKEANGEMFDSKLRRKPKKKRPKQDNEEG